MIRRNGPRQKREKLRAYGPPERRAWVASLPCSVRYCPQTPSENAHTKGGGMSRKADACFVIPLCMVHHRLSHAMGAASFEHVHGLRLEEIARRVAEQWDAMEAA